MLPIFKAKIMTSLAIAPLLSFPSYKNKVARLPEKLINPFNVVIIIKYISVIKGMIN